MFCVSKYRKNLRLNWFHPVNGDDDDWWWLNMLKPNYIDMLNEFDFHQSSNIDQHHLTIHFMKRNRRNWWKVELTKNHLKTTYFFNTSQWTHSCSIWYCSSDSSTIEVCLNVISKQNIFFVIVRWFDTIVELLKRTNFTTFEFMIVSIGFIIIVDVDRSLDSIDCGWAVWSNNNNEWFSFWRK